MRGIRIGCEDAIAAKGFLPALTDQEVLTLELPRSGLGYGSDKAIREYFVRHWLIKLGALKIQVQHYRERMLHWKKLQAVEHRRAGADPNANCGWE